MSESGPLTKAVQSLWEARAEFQQAAADLAKARQAFATWPEELRKLARKDRAVSRIMYARAAVHKAMRRGNV